MFAFVHGVVYSVENDHVVIDMNGIGLRVYVPVTKTEPRLKEGSKAFLHTHLQIREDDWTLYGFTDPEQLRAFRLLINVSGIGAKTALAIMNELKVTTLARAVVTQDINPFVAVSGVGKKTAQRLLLELKDKFTYVDQEGSSAAVDRVESGQIINDDIVAALKQLGYSAPESRAFTMRAQELLGPAAGGEDVLREALKIAYKS